MPWRPAPWSGRVIGIDRGADVALVRAAEPVRGHEFRFASQDPQIAAAVGTLQPPAGPAVGLVFDPGHDTELTFRLAPSNAREVGKLLMDEAEKLKDEPLPPSLRARA